jgi:LEA14-like dessication related protein
LGLQSSVTVFAAIAGLLAMMGGFVLYASLDNPELEKVTIELQDVKLLDVNSIENSAKLQVTFLVGNPSEKTFTVPIITYDLYANGESLGSGVYSTEDVSMPGRAAFYGGVEIPLKNTFLLTKDTVSDEIYDAIVNGDDIDYTASGMITVETSWSLIEKEF